MRSTVLCVLPLALLAAAPLAAAESIPLPAFKAVELRAGGHVVIRPGPRQQVSIVEGSSQFTRFHVNRDGVLKIDACAGPCPRHYVLRIEIQRPDFPTAAVTGGGTIEAASGFSPQTQATVAVTGGGQIDLRALRTASVTAAVQGGGKILAGPTANLTAAVSGGGEVRYVGNPEVTTVINSGGSVRRLR